MKYKNATYLWLLVLLAPMTLWPSDVGSVGIGQVMKAKSLPEATIALIDPESGTSSGTGGSDILLAVGDIILFQFAYAPVPDKSTRAMATYLTEYLPPNTEIVGVRLIDANGRTIEPRLPGTAVDGCSGGSRCNTYSNLPCNDGADNCSFSAGSIAQMHADTGVFYTTDARMARDPDDQFIQYDNGTIMVEEPTRLTDIDQILDITAPFRAHNEWDYLQVRAFGASSAESGSGGDGNTPYLYGSPVAGPQTFYTFEATENGGFGIEFNDVVGPWQRIRYPGSKIGFGDPDLGSSDVAARNARDPVGAEIGFDVTPATPIAGATALRYAVGESRVGTPDFVEVALRVTGLPIDPNFGALGDNLDCGEVSGSGLSARLSGFEGSMQPQTGSETQWAYYIASPGCTFLKLQFDLEADRDLTAGTVSYRTFAKNLSLSDEDSVVVQMAYDPTKLTFVTADVAPDGGMPTTCGTLECLTWTVGTMIPSAEFEVNTNFTTGGGGQISAVMEGTYTSSGLPAGFVTRDVVLLVPIAEPSIIVRPELEPTTTPVTPGTVANMVGTITNTGTNDSDFAAVELMLPPGWTDAGPMVVDGTSYPCTSDCGTTSPGYDFTESLAVGEVRAVTFPLNVASSPATGLADVGVQLWSSQTGGGFGGTFETAFPKAATFAVGLARTAKPVIGCPIPSTGTEVTGTSEADAAISLKFSLMERGTATADAAGDWLVNNFSAFGGIYGGLEVRATATAPGKLESELSDECAVTGTRECSDTLDNDGDGLIDFPADPGCDSPADNSEIDIIAECSDTLDNDGDGPIDFPADLGCFSALDPVEDLNPACSDGIDNDGDGLIDFGMDPGCASALDIDELTRPQCQDGIDNDGDGDIDFPADAFCNSAFDDDEFDISVPSDIKARLLIVFDSSGSMNLDTCDPGTFTGGDGSTECPGSDVLCATCGASDCGNGLPDDSRMAKVKIGLNNVIAGFGEVEYALLRFNQRGENFVIPDDCPVQASSRQSGGWQGGGAAPCGGGFDAGDLLVRFSFDNQPDLLAWMDGDSNYPGDPPPYMDQEIRGTGTTPLGGALGSALTFLDGVRAGDLVSGCRPYAVILLTDGAETCGGDPPAAAAALFAAGYPVHVIGFATSPAIEMELDAIAAAGGTSTMIEASDSAALSTALADIIDDTLLVERCNGLDDDCDLLVDEDFPSLGNPCDNGEQGVCFETGTIVCTADELGVVCDAPAGVPQCAPAFPECECDGEDDDCDGLIDEGYPPGSCICIPTSEVCNGIDDDCDSLIDEDTPTEPLPGVGDDCGIDIGECEFGSIICNAGTLECAGGVGPSPEICDGLDNDCDTLVDEIVETCYEFGSGCDLIAGTCDGLCRIGLRGCLSSGDAGYPGLGPCIGDVGPATETCNGLDDDCDGVIDNGFDVGDPCDNGQMGVCLVMGTKQCLPDGTGTFCTAFPVTPGTEVCNCLDDDCDGTTDEDLGPPVGNACGGGTACTEGTLECVACELSCEGAMGGMAEVCNGIDDDCDSIIDEDVPGEGDDCTDPGFEAIGDTGECEFGVTQCIGGSIICVDYEGPTPETCNGVDDDCDGMVDNEAICPTEEDICLEGVCVSPCELGEFPCPFGFICRTIPDEGDFCVPDPCLDVVCPAGENCNSDTGLCEDPCDLITCPGPGETCLGGACFDCFDTGFECEQDELCVVHEKTGTGQCVDNLCFGVECDTNQFCDPATGPPCDDLVCDPPCADTERCDDRTCVPDLCADVSCPGGLICDPATGRCVGDLCQGFMCPVGEACNPSNGLCEPDPCIGIDCPEGFECRTNFDGDAECVVPDVEEGEKIYAAGSGCACDIGRKDTSGNGAVLLLLIGAVLLRRRRRR